MAPTPGILYVTMQLHPSLSEVQFHDWYNNEHGPTRLRLPFCTNGFRYRASDLSSSDATPDKPEWMAIYDITDVSEMLKEPYLRLRDPPVKSQREIDTMKQLTVDRKLYDFVEERSSPAFKRLEEVENEGQGNVIVAVFLDLQPGEDNKLKLDKWYAEEHIELLSKVPGWLRTRRFVTSSVDSTSQTQYLALHEYAPQNGLGGKEFKTATTTKWADEIMTKVVKDKQRRVYEIYYTFGPAPRYLAPGLADWTLSDPVSPITRTYSTSISGSGAIDSWVTTDDGVDIPYRLEGSSDPDAPLMVLSNSVLVTYGIWDEFISEFFSVTSNKQYRILRYLSRGRFSQCGDRKVTVDVLASDIVSLLDALRVKKAAAVIGVSLGGVTALNTALKYRNRVASFISCDTSSKSPAGNSKAWGERIAMSEKEDASASSGEKIVGSELAEITTRRWFVPASYENPKISPKLEEVKQMVATNSLTGFKKGVEALFEYDLKAEMKVSKVRGAFLVGGSDGVLPATMKEMSANFGESGAEYHVIEGAGHLPMVEKPKLFAEFVTAFLQR